MRKRITMAHSFCVCVAVGFAGGTVQIECLSNSFFVNVNLIRTVP